MRKLFQKIRNGVGMVEGYTALTAMQAIKNPETPKWLKLRLADMFYEYLPYRPVTLGMVSTKDDLLKYLELSDSFYKKWEEAPFKAEK